MPEIDVEIIQGSAEEYPAADVNIVIDVIRAFTVTHVAFLRGAREIFLVNTVEEAFALRKQNPGYLLAGEVEGLPITGFDLDNSPHTISQANVENKSLVQKTTNGVKATLLALGAKTVLVTGLSNARKTALHARQIAAGMRHCRVNIVASHPRDDDDLACAEYIRDQMLAQGAVDLAAVQSRIKNSRPAAKFYDPAQPAFKEKDMPFCVREMECGFVMQVDRSLTLPRIVKQAVSQP
jgi:2-phosphosulfolactate phosphatase